MTTSLTLSECLCYFGIRQLDCIATPVPFSMEHKNMLAHCKALLEYQNGMVAIHPCYNKLITALRTAVENGEE